MDTSSRDSQSEPESTDLQQEAFAWLVRLTSGDTSPEEVKKFDSWKAKSPAHEQAWHEASRVWRGFEQLPEEQLPGRVPVASPSGPKPTHRKRRKRPRADSAHWRWTGALATTGLLLTLLFLVPPPGQWFADVSTGVGERRTVSLPDGSTVDLNSQTALQLEFTDTQRVVKLLSGEAVFQVVQDAARPFAVLSAGGSTRALGTEFIVRHRAGPTLVAIQEGTVEVRYSLYNQYAMLKAGEAARYGRAQGLQPLPRTDWDMLAAWREGYLAFQDTPLPDVLDQINLHRSGHIMLLDDALADHRISGVFRLDAMADVVDTIVDTTPARLASVTPYLVLLY